MLSSTQYIFLTISSIWIRAMLPSSFGHVLVLLVAVDLVCVQGQDAGSCECTLYYLCDAANTVESRFVML